MFGLPCTTLVACSPPSNEDSWCDSVISGDINHWSRPDSCGKSFPADNRLYFIHSYQPLCHRSLSGLIKMREGSPRIFIFFN